MQTENYNSIRPTMFVGLLVSIAMIGIALFFQYYMELIPCPLCIVQRVIVMAFAGLFLLALIQGPKTWGRRIYGLLFTLTSIAGLIVAGRHTWLQHLPPEKVPECGPGLEFWMKNLPTNEVVQKVFQGSGECAKVVWSFASLSIPEWSLIAFGIFLLFSLKLLFLAK
jgi:disulfide bond formation protein DsbB